MNARNANVLVVDDYNNMRRILRAHLAQIGVAHVEEATDGPEALAKLRDQKFDLVISDWNMAPMSGLELLKQVRADAQLKGVPFLMITAESRTDSAAEAEQAGADDHVAKPFNARMFCDKVESVMQAA